MTIAQQLAFKRWARDLMIVAVPIIAQVITNPEAVQQLGIPARVVAVLGLLIIPIVTALIKLQKENGKGLNYKEEDK